MTEPLAATFACDTLNVKTVTAVPVLLIKVAL